MSPSPYCSQEASRSAVRLLSDISDAQGVKTGEVVSFFCWRLCRFFVEVILFFNRKKVSLSFKTPLAVLVSCVVRVRSAECWVQVIGLKRSDEQHSNCL